MAYVPNWAEHEKLDKIERLKLEKDGLDTIRSIIETYAVQGYESIPKDELVRFKWAGLYEQKPRDGHFMMRVRIPSGIMTSDQARTLASIARDYGRDLVDITVRQSIQFHWLRIENVPDVFKRLESVGLFTYETCGDCPHPIVGNPLSGIDPHEWMDTSAMVREIGDFFMLNRDFSNLPRKFKMSLSASKYNSSHAEIQCLAFTPAVKEVNGEERFGFHIWVGGGLSVKPHLAKQLDLFVLPEDVMQTAIAVTTIYRDYGYREKHHHARLKFLMADWGAEKFTKVLLAQLSDGTDRDTDGRTSGGSNFPLADHRYNYMPGRGEDKLEDWSDAHLYGVHPQKQEGYSYVGLNVPVGRLSREELHELARIADTYGSGTLRTTTLQNIVVAGVPNDRVDDMLREPDLARLTPAGNRFMSRTVSCTGNPFCNYAIVETKNRARDTAAYLDERFPELDADIRINFVGCPFACGQKHIADIGLQGAIQTSDEGRSEAFELAVGGGLGTGAKFAETLKGRVKADEVAGVLEQFIVYYRDNRDAGETFRAFCDRVGEGPFQELLTKLAPPPKLDNFLAQKKTPSQNK